MVSGRDVLGVILVSCILLSSYVGMVQVVNGFEPQRFLRSVELRSAKKLGSCSQFEPWETLIVSADARLADSCSVDVYENSSLILSQNAEFDGSRMELPICLDPSVFHVDSLYSVVVHAEVWNKPLLGSFFSDASTAYFSMVGVKTEIGLSAEYVHSSRSLYLVANLTDVNKNALCNETVGFYVQFETSRKIGNGWYPLDSVQTDEFGSAFSSMALDVAGGVHRVKAVFEGNGDFGSSERVVSIQVPRGTARVQLVAVNRVADKATVTLKLTDERGFPLCRKLVYVAFGGVSEAPLYLMGDESGKVVLELTKLSRLVQSVNLSVSVLADRFVSDLKTVVLVNVSRSFTASDYAVKSSVPSLDGGSGLSYVYGDDWFSVSLSPSGTHPYAVLPLKIKGTYCSEVRYGNLTFKFYLNNTLIGESVAVPRISGPPTDRYFTWISTLVWHPDQLYNQTISVKVFRGSTLYGDESVPVDILSCPSNLVVYCPQAIEGDVAPVTLAFSGPRLYSVDDSNSFVSSHTLAPRLIYGGQTYVIDEGCNSSSVKLYVDGAEVNSSVTGGNGVAVISSNVAFSGTYSTFNITGLAFPSLYNQSVVQQIVNFTKVTVRDVGVRGGDFSFNCSLNALGGGSVYYQYDNPVEVKASLFGVPVYDLDVTLTAAKFVNRSAVYELGDWHWAWVVGGCGYAYSYTVISSQGLSFWFHRPGDANGDLVVNNTDLELLTLAWGSDPNSTNWNPDCDFNDDDVIDADDSGILSANLGEVGMIVDLDPEGCCEIPSGVTSSWRVSVHWWNGSSVNFAKIDFFSAYWNESIVTDNVGVGCGSWNPDGVGSYLFEARLNQTLSVVLASHCEQSVVDASLKVFRVVEVAKRPVNLLVDYVLNETQFSPGGYSVDFNVTALDGIGGEVMSGLWMRLLVNGSYYINENDWFYTNGSGFASKDWAGDYGFYNFTFETLENGTYGRSTSVLVLDLRQATNLTSLGGSVLEGSVNQKRDYDFMLSSVDDNCGGIVRFFVDSVFYGQNYASSGEVTNFTFTPSQNRTYFVEALFDGDSRYKPCNVSAALVVSVTPVSILFDISPKDFEPPRSLTLNATVYNATSGTPLGSGWWVKFYNVSESEVSQLIGEAPTNENGSATITVNYSSVGGAYAYVANVSRGNEPDNIVSSPVQLTVATPTELWLNVSRNQTSTEHFVEGFLKSASSYLNNRTIRISVNDRNYTLITSPSGRFNLTLNLQPKNNTATTYQVTVSFEGDEPRNATAYASLPSGTQYAVCTTVQFGLKPSVNTASFSVEPVATEVAATANATDKEENVEIPPPKTPEEMQQETENDGLLKTWLAPGNSWWTWFKCYARLHVDWLNLTIQGWVGFPFGLGLEECAGLTNIFVKAFEAIPDEAISVYQSAVINAITTTAIAFAGGAIATMVSRGSPWYIPALLVYIGVMSGIIWGFWGLAERNLARSVLYGIGGTLIGLVIGLYCSDFLSNWNRGLATASTPGTPAQVAAMKASVNYLVGSGVKAALILGFGLSFFDIPFKVATACLGLLALTLAWSRS